MGLLQGLGPEASLRLATAVGAHCVESPDATSGIPSCSRVLERIDAAWRQRTPSSIWCEWATVPDHGVLASARDVTAIVNAES
jgi:hypothetical protein